MSPMEQAYSEARTLILILLDRLGGETIITEKEIATVDRGRDIQVEIRNPISIDREVKVKASS